MITTAMSDLRPLDRLGSIKIKLGVLVAASVVVAAVASSVAAAIGWSPWWTIPVAVALALVLTQVLAHGMTAPLREMTTIAAAMAAGDYSRRVGRRARASSRDEVGALATAFNSMAGELEAVDTYRRELIATVSHELRTPITALQAVLENLVDGVDEPDPDTLRGALAQTERLGRLVGDLLDLSRVEAGQLALDREPVQLAELLADAVALARVGRPTAVFEVAVAPDDLRVSADRARLQQVLANLIDNALKHSPPGEPVSVSATAAGDRVLVDVVDAGPGIPAPDRQRVFDRFAASGSDGGTGLGLAIARWILTLHGGRIAVLDSLHGCHVRFELPTGVPTISDLDHQESPR